MRNLVTECEQEGRYTEARFFKWQQQRFWKNRQEITVGNESSAIILSLSPEEVVSTTSDASEKAPTTPTEAPDKSISLNDIEKDIFYARLRYLLATRGWEEANKETFQRLKDHREELEVLDALWVEYSQQRFGFSIQSRIWEEVDHNPKAFYQRIGWNKIYKVSNLIRGVMFSLSAPEGHLPVDMTTIHFLPPTYFDIFLYLFVLLNLDHFNTRFPTVVPYPVHLKGLPKQYAYIKVQVKGEGILNLKLYQNNERILNNNWTYEENIVHEGTLIRIPLPSSIWEKELTGSLTLNPLSGHVSSYPFVLIRISCPINQHNTLDINRLKNLDDDSRLYGLLEMQKRLLGESHPDIEVTLDRLIQRCEKGGYYNEIELLKQQKREHQENKINRQRIEERIEVGNESSALILFLSPDEEGFKELLKPAYVTCLPEIKLSTNQIMATATRFGEKLTRTICLRNSVPKTLLTGSWQIVDHPNDPPYTNKHPWISVNPNNFSSNYNECKISINTSKLLADSIYERWLAVYSNASIDTYYIKLKIQTASIPKASEKLPIIRLVLLLLFCFLMTYLGTGRGAESWLWLTKFLTSDTKTQFAYAETAWGWSVVTSFFDCIVLASIIISLANISIPEKIKPNFLMLVWFVGIIAFLFTAKTFWWVILVTEILEFPKYALLQVPLYQKKRKNSLYCSVVFLLTAIFGTSLGNCISTLNDFFTLRQSSSSPLLMLSLVIIGVFLAIAILYPSLNRWLKTILYQLSKRYLIRP